MIKDSIDIDRSPRTVWAFLTDPTRLPAWNPKVLAVATLSSGSIDRGHRYQVTYRMSGKDNVVTNEVEIYQPYERFELRARSGMAPSGHVREVYTLQPTSTGTRLVQGIDSSESGIPWWWRFVMAVLHRLGRPMGKRYLVQFKELVESAEEG
jgi:uncharacterized protein YndB with AHSA1/START domain